MKVWFRKFFALMVTALIITVESKQEPLSFKVEPGGISPYLLRKNVTLRCQVSGSKPSSLKIVKYGSNTILTENHKRRSLVYNIEKLRCPHMGSYVCLQQSVGQSEKTLDVPVNGCKPQLCGEKEVQKLQNVTVFSICIISYGDLNVSKIYFDDNYKKKTKNYTWKVYNQPQSSLYKDVEIRVSNHVKRMEKSRNITFRFNGKGGNGYKYLDHTKDLPQRRKHEAMKAPVSMTSKRDDENRTLTSPTVSETDHENETTAQMTSKTDDKNMTTIALNTSKTDYEDMTTTAQTESKIDDENTTSAPTKGWDMSETMTPTMTLTATPSPTATPTPSPTTTTTTPSPTATPTPPSPTTTTTTTTPSPTARPTPSPTTTTTTSSPTTKTTTLTTSSPSKPILPPYHSSQTATLQPRTEKTTASSSQSSSSNIAETTTNNLQRLRQNDNDNESLPYIILGVVLAAVLSISCMLGILVFRYRKLLFSERVRQALAGEQHSPSQDDDYDDEEEAIYQNADAIRDSLNMNKGRYVSDQRPYLCHC